MLSCPCPLRDALLPSQLLLGFPPFNHKQRALIEDKIRDEVPRFPRGMSDNARDFILTALNKDPMQRPTIRELLVHPWIRAHRRNGSMRVLLPQSPKQLAFEEVRSMTADQAIARLALCATVESQLAVGLCIHTLLRMSQLPVTPNA